MDSQEWAEQFPTVSVRIARTILKSHGFDSDTVREYAIFLWFDSDEQFVEIDHN